MENYFRTNMTTKQKCEKLANVLETVASKLRDTNIGIQVWEKDEPSMKLFIAQVHRFLKTSMIIAGDDENSKDNIKKDQKLLEDWPDIIS